jgi:hypothetical protein
MAAGLVTAMILLEDRERRRREEAVRQWKLEQECAERERLRQIEAARWKHLLDLALASREAACVREFLDKMERRIESGSIDPSLSEPLLQSIQWGRSKANQIDPVVRPLTELGLEPQAKE